MKRRYQTYSVKCMCKKCVKKFKNPIKPLLTEIEIKKLTNVDMTTFISNLSFTVSNRF